MKLLLGWLLLACASHAAAFSFTFGEMQELLHFGETTIMNILETYEFLRPGYPGQEDSHPFVRRMEKELKADIKRLSTKMDRYQRKLEIDVEAVLTTVLHDLPLRQSLLDSLREFDDFAARVNDDFDNFKRYSLEPTAYEKLTLENFARHCVSAGANALPSVMKRMHRLLVPYPQQISNTSLLVLLGDQLKEASSQMCSDFQSSQQLLFNLYSTIALTEIKGYTMIQFSYMLLRMYIPGANFTKETQLIKSQYETRTADTLRAVKTAMAFAPRDIWRCDPQQHKLDETYTELVQLFQGYIVNEVDMNPESTCKHNCAYYEYAKVYGCYQNQYCAHQRKCNGKVVNCQYIDSDMWICPSKKDADRRYQFIEYEDGVVYGKKESCTATTKVDSWWRWLFWHCSYCFCTCDDHNISSHRYLSLREVVADVAENKVVTGIRLRKVKKIVHLQIQQGQLLPRGTINETSITWKPIEEFSITDNGVKDGVDYHTFAWEKRAIDLDDLTAGQDHLLTGLRFRIVGSRVNLEIKVTPFDFATGALLQPTMKSFWHSNDITDRSELKFQNPDIPTRSQLPSFPDSGINQYLNFAASDRAKDAAQSTIPFLDTQPVEAKPPTPMSGAGIFHKGAKDSGGFVAMKLISYNFAEHMQVDLPPPPPVIQ